MRRVSILLAIMIFVPRVTGAAELVMFDSPVCTWCEMWEEEVGVVYDKTDAAKVAPLRRISIHDPRGADLRKVEPVVYTPTFVLIDNDHEVGRITGYPGEAHFWSLLQPLIEKFETVTSACEHGAPLANNGSTPSTEKTVC